MAMSKSQAIEILKRVDICCNAAETARDMAIAALQFDTTSFKKVWYKHHTGKQGKRKHLKMMLVCTECHYVWDTQAYAFSYCPGCGKYVMEYEEVTEDGN